MISSNNHYNHHIEKVHFTYLLKREPNFNHFNNNN